MPWEPQRNRNSLSPHGLKAAEGHGARAIHDLNSVGCPPMPDGILGAPFRTLAVRACRFTLRRKRAVRATNRQP